MYEVKPMLLELAVAGVATKAYFMVRKHQSPQLIHKLQSEPLSDMRGNNWQSLKSLSTDEMSEEEKASRRYFKHTSTVLAISVVTVFVSPSIIWILVPAILYGSYRPLKAGYTDLIKDHKVTVVVIDNIIGIVGLVYGTVNPPYLVATAFANWLYAFMMKNIAIAKDLTHRRLACFSVEPEQLVWVIKDHIELEIPLKQVKVGDIVVVDAGQIIGADGIIREGSARINEQALTGEIVPIDKIESDTVFAGTSVISGRIYLQVENIGADTVVSRLNSLVDDTTNVTQAFELRGKALADKYALPTIGLSLLAYPVAGLNGLLAILMAGPCYTMRLLGPISVLNYLEYSSEQGILIKDGRVLEKLKKVDTLLIDHKALLAETLLLGAIHSNAGYSEEQVLYYAAASAHHQTDALANAILHAAHEKHVVYPVPETVQDQPQGRELILEGQRIRVGSRHFMENAEIIIPPPMQVLQQPTHALDCRLVYVAVDEALAGVLQIQSQLHPEAKAVVAYFQEKGLTIYLISSTVLPVTQTLAEQIDIRHYFSDYSPLQTLTLIDSLQVQGHSVCFIGDGIKDALAMKKSQVGISVSGIASLSADQAPIILFKQDLSQLETLFDLAQRFEKEMSRSLLTSVAPNLFTVIGVFTGVIGFAASIGMFYVGLASGLVNVYWFKWHK